MHSAPDNAQRNAILNALSPADYALLQPHLEPAPLPFRHRMQSANRRIHSVYFIESGLGSVVAIGSGERRQAEVAVIGPESMTGLPVVLGAERSPCEIFMQVEGNGQCIAAADLKEAMNQTPPCFAAFCGLPTCSPCSRATLPWPMRRATSRSD
jgi:hypothetical protein